MRQLNRIVFTFGFCLILPCLSLAKAPEATTPGIKPLDGVRIQAVETYQNPKKQQLDFGLGLWPMDPYFNGFSVDVGYNRFFNKTYAWEVAHIDYIYSVDTGLTSQLADRWSVSPQTINRLNFVFSSNLRYTLAYGKFVFMTKYIKYFRASVLAGPAFVLASQGSSVGLGAGFRFETFVNNDFSWKVEVRDIYAFGNLNNNLAFVLGTAYGF